ncbi:MAG TPA: hypothetical protein VHC42_10530 [Rhizomicrobium sp.]|nr:hypothetical protein [Rhizomicrobium sp.]
MTLDSQQKELLGRAALEACLIKNGFEVARAHRDKGIDLIVFLDEPRRPFVARPIQLKASSGARFGLERKYARMTGLILAYAWNIQDAPRFFLMRYDEAESLMPAEAKETSSWKNGGYSWPKAPEGIRLKLEKDYENRWAWLRTELEKDWRNEGR